MQKFDWGCLENLHELFIACPVVRESFITAHASSFPSPETEIRNPFFAQRLLDQIQRILAVGLDQMVVIVRGKMLSGLDFPLWISSRKALAVRREEISSGACTRP